MCIFFPSLPAKNEKNICQTRNSSSLCAKVLVFSGVFFSTLSMEAAVCPDFLRLRNLVSVWWPPKRVIVKVLPSTGKSLLGGVALEFNGSNNTLYNLLLYKNRKIPPEPKLSNKCWLVGLISWYIQRGSTQKETDVQSWSCPSEHTWCQRFVSAVIFYFTLLEHPASSSARWQFASHVFFSSGNVGIRQACSWIRWKNENTN